MAADEAGEQFDEIESDTSTYRVYSDGRLHRWDPLTHQWQDAGEVEPPPVARPRPADPDPWDQVPPAMQILLKIVRDHSDRSTTATERLGIELPGKVAAMGTEIAKELRTGQADVAKELRAGLRNQAIAFFFAMIVLIVAVVTLAGYNMQVRAATGTGGVVEAGTGP